MKKFLLSAVAAGALAFTTNAQSYVPPVSQVAPGPAVTNPDFKQLPVVDDGLPDFNLPGMRTVNYTDAPTAPLVEGFGSDYSSSYVSSRTTESVNSVSDRASMSVDNPNGSEQDPQEGRWIDRDNDGYDPVIDEVEQGVETAVKATGEAIETVGEAIGIGDDDDDSTENMNSDSNEERGLLGELQRPRRLHPATDQPRGLGCGGMAEQK